MKKIYQLTFLSFFSFFIQFSAFACFEDALKEKRNQIVYNLIKQQKITILNNFYCLTYKNYPPNEPQTRAQHVRNIKKHIKSKDVLPSLDLYSDNKIDRIAMEGLGTTLVFVLQGMAQNTSNLNQKFFWGVINYKTGPSTNYLIKLSFTETKIP